MHRLIDIHTHKTSTNTETNLFLKNIILPDQPIPEEGIYSAGWHPWFIEKVSLNEIEKNLTKVSRMPQVIALGECGIDRAIHTPLEIQLQVFEMHLKLAALVQKPVILHAVRSYSDVLQLLKKLQFRLSIIFHDYRGNEQQTAQLLKFNSYFSFGEALLKYPNMEDKIRVIPGNRLFLETDESELSIEKIYLSAATALNLSVDELAEQIDQNYTTLFGDGLVKQD